VAIANLNRSAGATAPVAVPAPAAAPFRAHWATVRVETDTAVYVGRLYVPETKKRLSDLLCDDRPFLNLTQVSVAGSKQVEAYIAINKRFVRTVRVIHEGEPAESRKPRGLAEPFPIR
jgi:uncharacterized protein DUF6812